MMSLEDRIKETKHLNIYCTLERVDIDIDNNLHLELSRESTKLSSKELCELLRKYFVGEEIIMSISFLIRNLKLETRQKVEEWLNRF